MEKVYAVVFRYATGVDQIIGFYGSSGEADEACARMFDEGSPQEEMIQGVVAQLIVRIPVGEALPRNNNWTISPNPLSP